MAELDAVRNLAGMPSSVDDPIARNELNRERLMRQMGGGTKAARTVLAALGNKRQASGATLLAAGGGR